MESYASSTVARFNPTTFVSHRHFDPAFSQRNSAVLLKGQDPLHRKRKSDVAGSTAIQAIGSFTMQEHVPVLLTELVDTLVTDRDGCYVDATFGRGGHAKSMLERLNTQATLIGFDRDPASREIATRLATNDSRFSFENERFSQISQKLHQRNIGQVAGVYFDVGVSTPQIADGTRGFAFDIDGPLDMRMSNDRGESAASWINRVTLQELADVLRTYGEVRGANALAKQIVAQRPLHTTFDLVEVVKNNGGSKNTSARELAQVFQAIRIHINDELNELEKGLQQGFNAIGLGGRLGVITFHSLEHRLSRRYLQSLVRPQVPKGLAIRADEAEAKFVLKNCRPSYLERQRNPQSRSAMLQVVERIK